MKTKPNDRWDTLEPIPFKNDGEVQEEPAPVLTEDEILESLDCMSRRIDDLAREFNCLGYFDEGDDDGPRAA